MAYTFRIFGSLILASFVALACYTLASPNLRWISVPIGLIALSQTFPVRSKKEKEPVVCKLAGLKWTREDLAQNVLVTGCIGSGKTIALLNILSQIFQRDPKAGIVWLENKGDSHLGMLRIAKKFGREKDVIIIEVPFKGQSAYPKQRLNLVTAGAMQPDIVAEILADISTQGESRGKNASFFRQQTVTHIANGIRFLEEIKSPVTFTRLRKFLCDEKFMVAMLDRYKDAVRPETYLQWHLNYLTQAPDQLSGVIGSIGNALAPFELGQVAEIFSSDLPDTIDFNSIKDGKIISVICPSSFPKQKVAINQFIKGLVFYAGAERYDMRRHSSGEENLIALFIDEAQASAAVTDAYPMSILRDAKVVFVAATQDEQSFIPILGEAVAKSIVGKFRTRFIFSSESQESSKSSSGLFGSRMIWKRSYSSSSKGGSTSRSESEEPVIRASKLNNLPPHYCYILHPSKKFKRRVKLPLV